MLDEDSNNQEDAADILAVDLRRVTSSEKNALILEDLLLDECKCLRIFSDEQSDVAFIYDDNVFIVREGDDISYLGNLIGKSNRLEFLDLWHMPLNGSFRDGLAINKSMKEIYVSSDLGYNGFRCLAPFFRNTNSLEALGVLFSVDIIRSESMKGFALLLSQCQIPSLKRIYFEEIELSDDEYTVFARALNTQPQLEEVSLTNLNRNEFGDDNDSFLGHIALGATMKNWKSPCLKVLDLESSHNDLPLLVDDDGILSLVEGMENCANLERLNLAGHNTITEVGLRAISSLFQSKKFLSSINLRDMNITNGGMTELAPGLASLKSLKKLDLSNNNIGDEGLQALAVAQPDLCLLEELFLGSNASFSAAGLMSLSSVLQTTSSLTSLYLSNNSIDDEGLHAFITGMQGQCTIERLDLSFNNISSGVRSFAAAKMSALHRLDLQDNIVGTNDEAMEALVKGIEGLGNLERLSLNRVTSSGLSILATVFRSESCSLQEFDLSGTRMGDSVAIALANGLRGNESLRYIRFDHRSSITNVGWSAFTRLLCDTSSVNNTYSSNHTLVVIGCQYRVLAYLSMYTFLDLNKQNDQGVNVPMCKILMSHSDIDMTPLLQWKLKLLPFVITWCERARSSQLSQSRIAFERRKLSAMFQFVSGASLSVVEGCVHVKTRRNIDSSSRKRKINQ